MEKNDKWVYGEIVRKWWGISERTLATIVYDNGIQAYDVNTELVTLSRIRPNFLDTDQIGDLPTSITSHFPFAVCAPRLVSLRHNCS